MQFLLGGVLKIVNILKSSLNPSKLEILQFENFSLCASYLSRGSGVFEAA